MTRPEQPHGISINDVYDNTSDIDGAHLSSYTVGSDHTSTVFDTNNLYSSLDSDTGSSGDIAATEPVLTDLSSTTAPSEHLAAVEPVVLDLSTDPYRSNRDSHVVTEPVVMDLSKSTAGGADHLATTEPGVFDLSADDPYRLTDSTGSTTEPAFFRTDQLATTSIEPLMPRFDQAQEPDHITIEPIDFDSSAAAGDTSLERDADSSVELEVPDATLAPEGLEDQRYTAKDGEDLQSIARSQLGEYASDTQIKQYVRALQQVNGLSGIDGSLAGIKLNLPKVDNNGNPTVDVNGATVTFLKDGTFSVDGEPKQNDYVGGLSLSKNPDGSFNLVSSDPRHPDSLTIQQDGSFTRKSWRDGYQISYNSDGTATSASKQLADGAYSMTAGPDGTKQHRMTSDRPYDNFVLTEPKDGGFQLSDGKSDQPMSFKDDARVAGDRQKILDQAKQHFTDPSDYAKFVADMIKFENRMERDGLTSQQVSDTYKSISRLFEPGKDGKPVGLRPSLAQSIMSQLGTPTSINQGSHPLCAVSETRLYTKHPDKITDLVVTTATTGSWTASDGTTVKIPADDLNDYSLDDPDRRRSYASQLYHLAGINALLKSSGSDLTYGTSTNYNLDNNGRFGVYKPGDYANAKDFGGLSSSDMGNLYKLVSGQDAKDFVLMHKCDNPDGTNYTNFNDFDDFNRHLKGLSDSGRLPAVLGVHTSHPLFVTSKQALADDGGWHAVTITGYQPGKDGQLPTVDVDNQWGWRHDLKNVNLGDLYYATSKYKGGFCARNNYQ